MGMVPRNKAGFLVNLENWDEVLARDLAQECAILLTAKHWEMIHALRKLYLTHGRHPAMRVFIKSLHPTQGVSTMLELMQLFGERPLFTLSLIAGLPKPPHCI